MRIRYKTKNSFVCYRSLAKKCEHAAQRFFEKKFFLRVKRLTLYNNIVIERTG